MSRQSLFFTLAFVAAALVLPLLAPAPASAQGEGFLFQRPRVSVGLRAGYSVPRGDSQIFDFTREQLTIDKSDFNSPHIGFELAARATERLDIAFNVSYAGSTTRSEFRDWVDTDDLPIEQKTELVVTPVTLSLRAYLYERGRSVGRFAWVPNQWSPYAGVGGGWTYYRFEQNGDFVDFNTLDVFSSQLLADGWAPTAHVLAGAEFSVSPRLVLNGEGRYGWASGDLGQDFVDFDDMDLAGFQFTVGISARF